MKTYEEFMVENPLRGILGSKPKSFMDSIKSDRSGADAAEARAPKFNRNPMINYSDRKTNPAKATGKSSGLI